MERLFVHREANALARNRLADGNLSVSGRETVDVAIPVS